ncbi:MAG: hypothetical protein AAGG75_03950 [Bacteroidota bacterium]
MTVLNTESEVLSDAVVSVRQGEEPAKPLAYDAAQSVFYPTTPVPLGYYTVYISCEGYLPQAMEVQGGEEAIQLKLTLLAEEAPSLSEEEEAAKLYASSSIIGILPKAIVANDRQKQMEYNRLLTTLKLEPSVESKHQEVQPLLIEEEEFYTPSAIIHQYKKADGTDFEEINSSVLEQLRKHELIAAAGPLLNGAEILGHQLLVNFTNSTQDKALALLAKHHLRLVGGTAQQYYIAEATSQMGRALLDIRTELIASGYFTMVELNVEGTTQYYEEK